MGMTCTPWKSMRRRKHSTQGLGNLLKNCGGAGWNIEDKLETVVIGHRGVVSKQNLDSYTNLGIAKNTQESLQNNLALSAITWLRSIVCLTMKARAMVSRAGGSGGSTQ